MITQNELKELTTYVDGNLVRIKNRFKYQVGSILGSKTKKGICVKIKGKHYRLHQLVYLYYHGHIPDQLDHINRNPFDNRIENLRPATSSENARNRKIFENNKSGVKGVCWNKRINKWGVSCSLNKKQNHLGYFEDIFSAACVAFSARNKMHGSFVNHF